MKKIKGKLLAAAIALIGFSAASAVTGTVAWFTAANTVQISGMQIAAETEQGIVIANETHTSDADWKTKAIASHNGGAATFIPASTKDLTTWYHGLSDQANNGQSNVNYDTFNTPADSDSDGIYTATSPNHFASSAKNVYLLNKFYMQASAKANINNQDIYVKNLTISGTSTSTELDRSIRVGITAKQSSPSYTNSAIFAPLSGATANYKVNVQNYSASATYAVGDIVRYNGNLYKCTTAIATAEDWDVDHWTTTLDPTTDFDVKAITDTSTGDGYELVDNKTIPAYETAGAANMIEFDVYIWFEGEDENHKSANIKNTLDTLKLSFDLTNKNN